MAGFDLTLLTKKVEGLKTAFESGRFADALVGALETGNGLMQQRIFVANQDVEGNSFGTYIGKKRKLSAERLKATIKATKSRTDRKRIRANAGIELTYYQRKRANKGRQIVKKDLEFTGGLRRAIEAQIREEREAELFFNTTEAADIAHGQEQQITNIRNGSKGTTDGTGAVKIFNLNRAEREEVVNQGQELIIQILKQPNAV